MIQNNLSLSFSPLSRRRPDFTLQRRDCSLFPTNILNWHFPLQSTFMYSQFFIPHNILKLSVLLSSAEQVFLRCFSSLASICLGPRTRTNSDLSRLPKTFVELLYVFGQPVISKRLFNPEGSQSRCCVMIPTLLHHLWHELKCLKQKVKNKLLNQRFFVILTIFCF